MIVVSMKGGLGNQLFQYAIGRRLSLARGCQLGLDLAWYDDPEVRLGTTPRKYELGQFNIAASRAAKSDVERIRSIGSRSFRGRSTLARAGILRPRGWIRERTPFRFDSFVAAAGDESYLDGYWQAARYFSDIDDVIRADLAFEQPATAETVRQLTQIEASTSVGVHVRRGDYTTSQSHHPLCSAAYYQRAMERLLSRVPDAKFFVFSDDPRWAADNIARIGPLEVVAHNDNESGYEDLRMFAACRHHVIANSTFSWWGAWLNPRPGKIVIAPDRWLTSIATAATDLLPSGWEVVEA